MWKKEVPPVETPRDPLERKRNLVPPTRSTPSVGRAVIGAGITLRGDVTGKEDLVVQGHVDGSVDVKEHAVTVGPEGRVLAHISARVITVEGIVEGDLTAADKVVLRGTARVLGDIYAPRVVMDDGASFRGNVDMGKAPITVSPPESPTSRTDRSAGGFEASAGTGRPSERRARSSEPPARASGETSRASEGISRSPEKGLGVTNTGAPLTK